MQFFTFFRTRGKYGEGSSEERFTYTLALVFVQCVVNYLYALFSSRYILRQTGEDTTKSSYYAICSFSYLTAMVTSNKALMWVNYPTQVVGKSCKPIPVMVLGVLIGRKRYPALKYLFVLLIVAGVAMFMYKDDKASASKSDDTAGILGKMQVRKGSGLHQVIFSLCTVQCIYTRDLTHTV